MRSAQALSIINKNNTDNLFPLRLLTNHRRPIRTALYNFQIFIYGIIVIFHIEKLFFFSLEGSMVKYIKFIKFIIVFN